jgi:hypothetical protein
MSIEMANVMVEDADHHVKARRIELFVQVMFGPKEGQKSLIAKLEPHEKWWTSELFSKAMGNHSIAY